MALWAPLLWRKAVDKTESKESWRGWEAGWAAAAPPKKENKSEKDNKLANKAGIVLLRRKARPSPTSPELTGQFSNPHPH